MPDLDHLNAEELRGGFLAAALDCANADQLPPCAAPGNFRYRGGGP